MEGRNGARAQKKIIDMCVLFFVMHCRYRPTKSRQKYHFIDIRKTIVNIILQKANDLYLDGPTKLYKIFQALDDILCAHNHNNYYSSFKIYLKYVVELGIHSLNSSCKIKYKWKRGSENFRLNLFYVSREALFLNRKNWQAAKLIF